MGQRLLTREDIQMANKHMERCSTSYAIRKCKLKQPRGTTTHLLEWPKSKRVIPPSAGEQVEQLELPLLVECKTVQTLQKTVWQFLIKANILLPYDPTIIFLNIHPNEVKTGPHKNLNVYSIFVCNCQKLEATKISFSGWIDKYTVVDPDNGVFIQC